MSQNITIVTDFFALPESHIETPGEPQYEAPSPVVLKLTKSGHVAIDTIAESQVETLASDGRHIGALIISVTKRISIS